MKVASKYKVNFLHFFPVCPGWLNRFHIPTERSSAVLPPVETKIFTLLSCKPLWVTREKLLDTLCGEMMTLCWLTFIKMSLCQPELLSCPSQVSLYRKPMPPLSQVVLSVIQQSTLLPRHFLPSCLLSQIMKTYLRGGFARSSFFEKHVLTQWSVRGIPDWVDKCAWWIQRGRFCRSCGFFIMRGTMMTLCVWREKGK